MKNGTGMILRLYFNQLRVLYYYSGILERISYMVIRTVKHLVALALVL